MKRQKLRDGSQFSTDGIESVAVALDGSKTFIDGSLTAMINHATIDADGGVFFARQLAHIKAASYDVRYANLVARDLFPVSNEGGPGVTTIVSTTYDQVGAAKIITSYSGDIPRADISGEQVYIPVRTLAIKYGYSMEEIQSAQLVGYPLNERKAIAAREGAEITINRVAFNGDAESGLPGLFSNPYIPSGSVVNPGSGTAFTTKNPDQIIFDINDLCADIHESTKMRERPNTLLLPPAQWSYIMSTPRATNSDTTIGQYLIQNSPYLNSTDAIIPVNECAAINNSALSVDVMVAYDRSPNSVQLEIPMELVYRPVQEKDLEFEIVGHVKLGGLNVHRPGAFAIGEGI